MRGKDLQRQMVRRGEGIRKMLHAKIGRHENFFANNAHRRENPNSDLEHPATPDVCDGETVGAPGRRLRVSKQTLDSQPCLKGLPMWAMLHV